MTVVAALLLLLAAQDSPTDRLTKELDRLKAENAALASQVRALTERLKSPGFLELEEKHLELARSKKALEDQLKAVGRLSTPVDPRLRARVTAVANEIGLVVLSVGTDDGVQNGDEYTIYRGGDFVAKVVVDRAERKWSAGKVTLKKSDPRVADEATSAGAAPAPASKADELYRQAEESYASGDRERATLEAQKAVEADPNHLAARTLLKALQAFSAPATPRTTAEVQALRKELDEVRKQVQTLTDRMMPSWKDAGVVVEEASEPLCSQLQIPRGLVVRRVREGSPAAKVLKVHDVIVDRTEAQLAEVLRSGGPLSVRRQGKLEVFQVDPVR